MFLISPTIFAQDLINTPEWLKSENPIKESEIPEKDYPYLANWIEKNSKPIQSYFIDLSKKHQIIIFGEQHNIKEHKDLIIELIPRLYHEAGVRCIGWEFSRYSDNDKLDRLINASDYDSAGVLEFARSQIAHEWNSKEHWDIIRAVWKLNHSLEPGLDRLRLVGLDINEDMSDLLIILKTKPKDSPEYKEVINKIIDRDRIMAEHVEKEIIEKGQKGLVFVGRGHDYTHHELSPDNPFMYIMGNILYKKYGDRIFQVWPSSGWFPLIEKIMELKDHQMLGFDIYNSPFANILCHTGRYADPDAPFCELAQGYIYLGPKANLHSNTSIKGFVTPEMFKRYKDYYEIDFDQTFTNGKQVDQYLQVHRWPKPNK